MSKLTVQETFFGLSDLPPEQLQTAHELYPELKEPLERLVKNSRDQITIGRALRTIHQRHGKHSEVYMGFLASLKEQSDQWSNDHYRDNIGRALNGYEAMAGSDADKEFIWKLNPSLSALAKVQTIHPSDQYKFLMELKDQKKFPTAAGVDTFAARKRLPSGSKPKTTQVSNLQFSQPTVSEEAPVAYEVPHQVVESTIESNPVGGLSRSPVQQAEVVETKPLTDFEKFASACDLIKSIRDLDALNVDAAALSLAQAMSYQLDVLHSMSQPKYTRPVHV